MAAADPAFEFLQRFQSMMESFDECLSQLCKDNISESARDLRKNLMESYHDLQKALQSRYETLKIKEKKLEFLFNRVLPAVSVRSEIKIFCDKADGRGLRNYIRDHMNEGEALQKELFVALLKEPDAVKLVINALEPPFFQHKKASILLFECLYLIFGNDDSCVFPSDIKDSAREIAKAWKKEMNMENSNRASRVNIMAFLKFLASFKIAADYERDELWRLLLAVLTNEQTLELCRSLGLSPNVSEFIDMLSKDGKRLEALRYADTFGMLDKVDHVDLMTSYLRDVEKAGKEVVTNAQGTAASQVPGYTAMLQRDAAMKLKAALRGVINTCRKYGLESHFFEDKLKRLGKGGEPEEQPEPGTRGKNNESKTSKVTGLNPGKNSNNARINRKKAARKNAEQEEDGKKAAEKKAQERKEKEDGNNAAKKKAENIEEEEKKAAEKKAQEIEEREDRKKDGEKKAREIEEKEDGNKAVEKRAQEKEEKEEKEGEKKDAEKTAQEKENGNKVAGKKVQEKDGKKDAGKNAQEEAGKKDAEKKAREKEDGRKAAEKKAEVKEEREDGKKAAENEAQHKRRQSFDPGYGLSKRENYASKRVKVASPNETTRVVGGMDNSKPSPYNIDGVQNNYRFIGHDHHPSASGAANTGLAAGAFASVPSIGAQINNERRRHEGYPLAFGTSNLTPIGSSLYSASVPAGRFAVPLSNVAEVNYDGRVQESYKLNFGEIHNNPVRASSYVTGVSTNSFATQSHYARRAQELYTSKLGGGNTVGIESSVYGSNPCAIPSSVNQGNRESSLGQSSGFAGRNAVPAESSGYRSGVSTVPPSSVSQGPFERRGSVMEFIDMLSKGGKQLEVLRYADAFGMLDKVDHVELLTSYLRDVENAGKEVVTNGQGTAASQEPEYMAKLQTSADIKLRAALRAVINLSNKYGLKSNFFEEKLRNLEQGKEPEEQLESGTRGKNNESKTSNVTGLIPSILKLEQWEEDLLKNSKSARRNKKKAAKKNAEQEEDGMKAAEKKAQEIEEKEDGKKAAEKRAQEKEEKEDGKKDDAEKKAQHKRRQSIELGHKLSESENYASKRAKHASSNETTRVVKQKAEQEDGKKASEIKALEKEDGKNTAEKNAQESEDGKKAAEKKAQVNEEREVGKKAAENKAQHKRHQSFEPGYGLSERENYASKRAKDASLNETTRVVGMDNSKPSPYNIDGVQYNYGVIGHHYHPSASSAANAVLATGAFASVPSIGAQINNERRRHEGNPLVFGTSNLTPIGSSLYSTSVPAGPFAAPLSNVAAVNYDGRGQQSYAMNFVEVDKYRVRTSVYGTRDLSNSFAMQNNYNFEGRGEESYKLNFGEIHNNPVRASSHVTGVSANSSATECDYERRVTELYTLAFGRGNTAGIGSSVYGSNPCTILSGVNQGSHERSLGQSSGFAGRNAVPPSSESTTVPLSSVSQGHVERRGSVISKYTFNSG